MTDPSATLRPVTGSPRAVEALVQRWLDAEAPDPLTVRTSGSTGRPKDVVLSAIAMRASATATLRRLGGPGGWVLALPAHYVAGLQVIVRSLLAHTSPVVLDDHYDLSAATAELTSDRRYLALVPTQLHRWMQSSRDLEALRSYDAVLLGGAAAAPRLLDAAREHGIQIVTTYGMSETSGGCVYDGLALDGVAVAIGTDGRVRLTGPVLFDGYDGQPELTAEVLRDGWLSTPDLGRFDDDGRLEILGRADDVVISGGVNVPLTAVARRLSMMPGVAQCEVVAAADEEWGSRVVALIVPSGSANAASGLTLATVRDFVAAEHPRAWAPRELLIRPELPLLESGKVDRQAVLRELAAASGDDA